MISPMVGTSSQKTVGDDDGTEWGSGVSDAAERDSTAVRLEDAALVEEEEVCSSNDDGMEPSDDESISCLAASLSCKSSSSTVCS